MLLPKRASLFGHLYVEGEGRYTIRTFIPVTHPQHDIGNLSIYVVDDAGADELGNDLSVELVPNEPGSIRIHVHIADPTSVLPPTLVLAHATR